jgi:DNA-binding NarL/FixJ family response regulator
LRKSEGAVAKAPIGEKQEEAVIMNQIRVLSVDELPLMREGIATVINAKPDMQVVAHASSAHEAIRRFREHRPDVTVMDLRLPDMSGIDAMIAIREEFPKACIVVFTSSEGDMEIKRAFAAGAHSYMLKSTLPNDLAETIRKVHEGKKSVPPEVAARIAEHRLGDRCEPIHWRSRFRRQVWHEECSRKDGQEDGVRYHRPIDRTVQLRLRNSGAGAK